MDGGLRRTAGSIRPARTGTARPGGKRRATGARRGLAALLAASFLASFGCRRAPPGPGAAARSLVVFCFDTVRTDAFLRHDDGAPDALTAWDRRAVLYDHARSPAPWTLPSIASVVTGLYPSHHGAGRFSGPVADLDEVVPSGIAADVPSLGQAAAEAGFATRAFVASPWADASTGVLRGFARVDALPTRRLREPARRWIEERRPGRPFFLYVHWMDSHGGGTFAKQRVLAGELEPGERSRLAAGAPAGTCRNPSSALCARYLAYHRGIDLQRADAAALLAALERRGLLRETLVVLFSDHGEEFGEHRDEERGRGTDPRGVYGISHGHALYEELLRVPLVVWCPGESPRRESSPVSLIDVAPTVLARLGLSPFPRMQGRRLAAARGEAGPARPFFASSIAYGPPQSAVLLGEDKEIEIECPESGLLFDLRTDAAEKRPGRASGSGALRSLLARYRAEERTDLAPARLSSEAIARLRSLGYLRNAGSVGAGAVSRRRPAALGVYDPNSGTFELRSPGGAVRSVRFGAPGDLPVVGDWDGDGTTDLGVFRPSEGVFRLAPPGAPAIPVPPDVGSVEGDVPIAGDWDGDRVDTVAIYRPSVRTLFWSEANRPGARWLELHPPWAGMPVPGKWRCAGRSGLAIFTADARFSFAEANVAPRPVPFGAPGDLPVAGDWDGDGSVTIGVYRPSTGEFLLRNDLSNGTPDLVVDLGRKRRIPVVGRW